MKFAAALAIAASALVISAPASAQFAKPEDAAKYRQSAMFLMNTHVGRIGAMVNGRIPYDAKVAVDNAETVAELAKLPWPAFGPGYDKVTPTRAKADIWTDQSKFRQHSDKLMGDSEKLLAAAKTNNLDNLKAAFASTAGTCKSCHDDFRRD